MKTIILTPPFMFIRPDLFIFYIRPDSILFIFFSLQNPHCLLAHFFCCSAEHEVDKVEADIEAYGLPVDAEEL